MMKRLLSVLTALILCIVLSGHVHAAGMPRLVDSADLLTDFQEAELLERLDRVSMELQVDLVIVTMESCGGYSADQVVEAYYDQYGFGYGPSRDGVLLMLSMEERDWRILSNGFGSDAIPPSDIDYIGDNIVDELSDGAYMDAFMEFIDLCRYEIEGERYGFPFEFGLSLTVSVIIGLVVALIVTLIMRSKLKSVRSRTGAREYAKPGSMKITRSSDLFLYRTLDRREKPKESSSGSHGGGGGRSIGGGKF